MRRKKKASKRVAAVLGRNTPTTIHDNNQWEENIKSVLCYMTMMMTELGKSSIFKKVMK